MSQLLQSHVYLSSNRHRQSAQIHVDTHGLDICLLLCCHLVRNCFNDAGIVYSSLRRYPSHIRCPNYWHRMSICQAIVIQESLKFTLIHPGSRIDCFHAPNLCPTTSMMEVFWRMLYTGTPHIFGVPTTAITGVFVKPWAPKSRSD